MKYKPFKQKIFMVPILLQKMFFGERAVYLYKLFLVVRGLWAIRFGRSPVQDSTEEELDSVSIPSTRFFAPEQKKSKLSGAALENHNAKKPPKSQLEVSRS